MGTGWVLHELESRARTPRGIAMLRIEALSNDHVNGGLGFAAEFVSFLGDSLDEWFDHVRAAKRLVATGALLKPQGIHTTSGASVSEEPEEKKDETGCGEMLLSSSSTGVVANGTDHSRRLVAGHRPTEVLLRLLRLYADVCHLDPTLGEELGRQGAHQLLSRLIRCDLTLWDGAADEDEDAVMECQDKSCEIAALAGGSFPVRTMPFAVEDLKARLPQAYTIRPLCHAHTETTDRQHGKGQSESETILIRQVTARQSAQEDVGFGKSPPRSVPFPLLIGLMLSFEQYCHMLD